MNHNPSFYRHVKLRDDQHQHALQIPGTGSSEASNPQVMDAATPISASELNPLIALPKTASGPKQSSVFTTQSYRNTTKLQREAVHQEAYHPALSAGVQV